MCVAIMVFVPASRSYPYWVQMNVYEENARGWLFFNPKASFSGVEISDEVRKEFFSQDLAGKPVIEYPAVKPNVLIVLVEGLGYETFSSELMPATSELAKRNIFYSNFINVQRQTNRGLYALICGDYPNFLSIEAKSDFVAMYGPLRPCLPEVLRRDGFRTVFMQSANLGYMQKGPFAEGVGFEERYGDNSYDAEGKSNDWGVDDLTLYGNAFRKIQELEGEKKPWFATLLTSGTHHPYNVPGLANPTYRQAVRYADSSLKTFLDNLRESGILEKTLVFITRDESSGSRGVGVARELSVNHAPLIVLAPNSSRPSLRDEPFMQSDIFLSIVDYAGLESGRALGRSIFRSYESGRNLIFGNIYARKAYSYDARGYAHICSEELACSVYKVKGEEIMGSSYEPVEPDAGYLEKLRQALLHNELNSGRLDTEYVFHMENKPYAGFNYVVGDHKFSASPGDWVMWTAQILAQDNIKVFAAASIPIDGNVRDRAPIFKFDEFVPAGKAFSIHETIDVESDIPEIWTMVFVDTGPTGKYVVEDLAIKRIRRK